MINLEHYFNLINKVLFNINILVYGKYWSAGTLNEKD